MSKLKKSQSTPQLPVNSSKINHTTIKRTTEPQPNLHSTVSVSPRSPLESLSVQSTFTGTVVSSPVKSPGTNNQPKRKRLKTDRSLLKDREYDPDRHCGVWNDETGKPCTRSLTCKAHTVSLRRTVAGRSKTFDKLLADHRASKELPASRPAKITVSGTVTVASDSSNLNSLAPGTPVSSREPDVPSSPPVLSLPDTYPLPQVRQTSFLYIDLELRAMVVNVAKSFNVIRSDGTESLRFHITEYMSVKKLEPMSVGFLIWYLSI